MKSNIQRTKNTIMHHIKDRVLQSIEKKINLKKLQIINDNFSLHQLILIDMDTNGYLRRGWGFPHFPQFYLPPCLLMPLRCCYLMPRSRLCGHGWTERWISRCWSPRCCPLDPCLLPGALRGKTIAYYHCNIKHYV